MKWKWKENIMKWKWKENEMKKRIKWNENANKMKCYQIVLNIELNQSNKDCIDYKVHKIL